MEFHKIGRKFKDPKWGPKIFGLGFNYSKNSKKLQLSTSRAQDLPLKPGQEKNFQIENSEQAGHTSKNYHDMGDSGITYNQGEDGSNLLKLDTGAWDDEGKTDDYLFAFQILFCGSK